jgi:hypothetical protein
MFSQFFGHDPVPMGGNVPETNEHALVGDDADAYHHQQDKNFLGTDLYSELSTSTGGYANSVDAWVEYEMACRGHPYSQPLPHRLPQGLVGKLNGRTRAMAVRYDPTGRHLAVGLQLGGAVVLSAESAHNSMRTPLAVEAHDQASDLGWSLLDVAWHEQGNLLVRSGWSGTIAVLRLATQPGQKTSTHFFDARRLSDQPMGIFSVAMMGNTVVAATNVGLVFAADLEVGQVRFHANIHALDVNAVCSVSSLHGVFASGGDDGVINITDLRTKRPAACFGHSHGITSLDSRGDERYIVSNCKDQTAKIFDLRRAATEMAVIRAGMDQTHRSLNVVDYRAGPQLTTTFVTTRMDNSERTLTGHNVYYTLLRSRFSPLDSTGGRYIACGATDGQIAVYDILTGSSRYLAERRFSEIIRDVTWHPDGMHIAAACIDGAIRIYGPDSPDERREADLYAKPVVIPLRGIQDSSASAHASAYNMMQHHAGNNQSSDDTTEASDDDDDDEDDDAW